jgi:probable HAF family extracellular repeat protein
MSLKLAWCIAIGLLPLLVGAEIGAAEFQGLGDLPGGKFDSHAWGVSGDGKFVVGSSNSAIGDEEAFRWSKADGMQALGGLKDLRGALIGSNRINSRAKAVSDDGSVVVGSSLANGTQAFRWTKDGMQNLGSLKAHSSHGSAAAISADGMVICGKCASDFQDQAFRWTKDEGMQGLGFLGNDNTSGAFAMTADGATIVGISNLGTSRLQAHVFKWTKNEGMATLGMNEVPMLISGISGDGMTIVGNAHAKRLQAFKWTAKDGLKILPDLPGGHELTSAEAISRDGKTVVGFGYVTASAAVRWTDEGGVESIQKLLTDRGVDTAGWQLWCATGVSADGNVIVGWGTNPKKNWEAWRADLSDGAK